MTEREIILKTIDFIKSCLKEHCVDCKYYEKIGCTEFESKQIRESSK